MAKFFFLYRIFKGRSEQPFKCLLNVRDSWVEKHVFIIVFCILFPSKSLLYVIIMQWKCSRTSGSHWVISRQQAERETRTGRVSDRPDLDRGGILRLCSDRSTCSFLISYYYSTLAMPKRKKTALVRSRNVRLALERKKAARNVSLYAGQLDPPTTPGARLLHIKTYKWLVNHMHTKNTSVVF